MIQFKWFPSKASAIAFTIWEDLRSCTQILQITIFCICQNALINSAELGSLPFNYVENCCNSYSLAKYPQTGWNIKKHSGFPDFANFPLVSSSNFSTSEENLRKLDLKGLTIFWNDCHTIQGSVLPFFERLMVLAGWEDPLKCLIVYLHRDVLLCWNSGDLLFLLVQFPLILLLHSSRGSNSLTYPNKSLQLRFP